jgi:hypothetical protein
VLVFLRQGPRDGAYAAADVDDDGVGREGGKVEAWEWVGWV